MLKQIYKRMSGQTTWDAAYWRKRASDPDTVSVMWANRFYNEMADRDEWRAIQANLPERRAAVLDLGCGTGRMGGRLAECFASYTGVDLDTMVAEARRRVPSLAERFLCAALEEYEYPQDSFDLVLSMGCLAVACSDESLREIAERMVGAVRKGGKIILIEPFHRNRLLTRGCRLGPREVIDIFTALGMTLNEWGGMLFFPARMVLTEMKLFYSWPRLTGIGYGIGEALLRIAPRLLSDYCVIVLTKTR
jgi:SAM-dependent methyltransferase